MQSLYQALCKPVQAPQQEYCLTVHGVTTSHVQLWAMTENARRSPKPTVSWPLWEHFSSLPIEKFFWPWSQDIRVKAAQLQRKLCHKCNLRQHLWNVELPDTPCLCWSQGTICSPICSCWLYTRVGLCRWEWTRTVGAKQDSSSSLSLSVSALGSSPSSDSFFTSIKKQTHTFVHSHTLYCLNVKFLQKELWYFNSLP